MPTFFEGRETRVTVYTFPSMMAPDTIFFETMLMFTILTIDGIGDRMDTGKKIIDFR